MKHLKRFEQVKGEDEYEIISELIKDFHEDNGLYDSFINTKYCQTGSFKDISNLSDFLTDKGYNLDKFMKEYKSEIYSDDFFLYNCGFMDLLLYSYDKKNPLSGMLLNQHAPDEHAIQYSYGYQYMELGKKYILQSYDSLSDFYYETAKSAIDFYDLNEEVSEAIQFKDFSILMTFDKLPSDLTIQNNFKPHHIYNKYDNVNILLFGDGVKKIIDFYQIEGIDELIDNLKIKQQAKKYNL